MTSFYVVVMMVKQLRNKGVKFVRNIAAKKVEYLKLGAKKIHPDAYH